MKVVQLDQGSDAWLAHRRTVRNASDAPAMMGASPYVTRAELVRRKATGIEPEIDAATQARFDKGHAVEPALRALAEAILGEDLYPVTAVSDDGHLGASFDGVDISETVIFEAKQHNAEKRAQIADGIIPPADYWQIVQQFAVCATATQCLYLCGDGSAENTAELWIERDEIEADIPKLLAGWAQLDADVAAYVPEPEVLAPAAGAPVEGFGALSLRVTGKVLESNLDTFRAGAEAFLARLPKPENLQSDQDFADADTAVKACAEAESRIKAAKDAALAQMADVEAVMRTADTVSESIRQARLALDKLVKARKEAIKGEIVAAGAAAVRAHYDGINATLGAHALQPAQTLQLNLGAAIKGLRSIKAMRDALDASVAAAKIEASQYAERVRANIAILQEHAGEHRHLFADAVQLCATKQPDDLRNLVALRIAEHQKREEERLEAERARIRQEEADRLAREQQERDRAAAQPANDQRYTRGDDASAVVEPESTVMTASGAGTAPTPAGARIKLGDINTAIAPLSVNADGLAQLGFRPVGTAGAAKLYDAGQFDAICIAMQRVLTIARTKLPEAA